MQNPDTQMTGWRSLDDDAPGWETSWQRAEFRRLDGSVVTGSIEVDEAPASDSPVFTFIPDNEIVLDVWTECDAWRLVRR